MRHTLYFCCIILSLLLLRIPVARAQEAGEQRAHWGVQEDIGTMSLRLKFASPLAAGTAGVGSVAFSIGMMRFSAKGTPSFGVSYSRIDFNFDATLEEYVGSTNRYDIQGSAFIHGLMLTKYIYLFRLGPVRTDGAIGVGIGKFSLDYAVRDTSPEESTQEEQIEGVMVPLFELLLHADADVPLFEGAVSIGPMWGLRNGVLVFGGALRMHF